MPEIPKDKLDPTSQEQSQGSVGGNPDQGPSAPISGPAAIAPPLIATPILDAASPFHPEEADFREFWKEALAPGDSSVSEPDTFGVLQIEEYRPFKGLSEDVVQGTVRFEIETTVLDRMLQITRLTVAEHGTMSWVQFEVCPWELRARTFNRATFSECRAALYGRAIGLGEDKMVTFVVSHKVISTALQAASSVIRFTLNCQNGLLDMISENFERPIRLEEKKKFVRADEIATGKCDPSSKRVLSQDVLRRALNFVTPAIFRDDIQAHYSVLEARDGMLLGGRQTAIAVAFSPVFKDWEMQIRYELIAGLSQMVDFLEGQINQIDTPTYTIMFDQKTQFGFEKTSSRFPSIVRMLAEYPEAIRICLSCSALLPVLKASRAVSVNPVRFTREAFEYDCTVMSGAPEEQHDSDAPRNKLKAKLHARPLSESDHDIDVRISLEPFIRAIIAVAARGCANVTLEFNVGEKLLSVLGGDEEDLKTKTFIPLVNPTKSRKGKSESLRNGAATTTP